MTGLLLESPPFDVFGQMALDEALAKSKPATFWLRFFRWKGGGVTFGYAQRIREVEKMLPPLIGESYTRRPTGGGIVPHVDDLTLSCVFPDGGVLRPTEIYRRLHSAILRGLCAAGLEARLCIQGDRAAPQGPEGASQCFAKPMALDILSGEGKILGGAIRRYGNTVLYQGSLQVPDARNRAAEFEAAIGQAVGSEWKLQWERRKVAPAVLAEAASLEAKYRSPEWIRKM